MWFQHTNADQFLVTHTQAEVQRRTRNYLDHRRSLVESMTRFPQAIQESEKHLDLLLLERCPNDIRALPDMGASLSTSGASSKRKKKKKKDKAEGTRKAKKQKRAKKKNSGGFCGFPATTSSPGFGTPGTPGPASHPYSTNYPYPMVGATPSPYLAPGMATGMPFTTPVTGTLYPAAAHHVYAVQQRAMQAAMTHLAASGRSGGPLLPPSATGYPNLHGGMALPRIRAAGTPGSKPKKSSKAKKSNHTAGDDVTRKRGKEEKQKRDPTKAAMAAPDWVKKSMSKKQIRARNVGGPIPSDYAKQMQRGWLDHDDGLIPQGSKQFIPQAGDLVL